MKLKLLRVIFFIIIFSLNLGASAKILNINNIVKSAIEKNKQVMVFFHMTHCGYCKRMEKKTFQNNDVKNIIKKKFIFIDINIDSDEKVLFEGKTYSKKNFANHLDVDFYPTVLFFDENLEITYTARGYRNIKKFRKILKYIHTKSYEKVDFFDYKKENEDKE